MRKVLVVEDDGNNMRLMAKLLQGNGYEVIKAENGEEGLRLAIEEEPDLILMDIRLPGMDGVAATRRIRDSVDGSKVAIIAITSYAMAGDRERFLAEGFNGYIEKPIDPYKIIEEIEEYARKTDDPRSG
ncbi:MAG TPA: response regulator [Methanosarcinales archaeon]|nr:response regulator [Methanosarcinales archaeon]